MSKGLLITLLVLGALGYYLYRINWFTEISAKFDYTPDSVSVTALYLDLHNCKLNLTNDFAVEIPLIRENRSITLSQNDFKEWNGAILESIKDLGPTIEFKMRCDEGKIETNQGNRYATSEPAAKEPLDGK
jgi:hypothetical protein